jgi:HAD superfamily hydrolase (TIGR01509 family)
MGTDIAHIAYTSDVRSEGSFASTQDSVVEIWLTPDRLAAEIGRMAIRAILWDLDGVLVNSMDFHYQAFREVLTGRGRELSREEYLGTIIGLRNDAIFKRLLPGTSDGVVVELALQKEEAFRRLIAGRVQPLPGSPELVRRAKDAGLRQAIVSSTPRENIALILRSLALENSFDAIVGEEDATRGKPDPEGFRVAARRLRVAPAECLVIEDAPEGITAGKAAGMLTIGVSTTRPPRKLSQADLVVATLEDARVWEMMMSGRQ